MADDGARPGAEGHLHYPLGGAGVSSVDWAIMDLIPSADAPGGAASCTDDRMPLVIVDHVQDLAALPPVDAFALSGQAQQYLDGMGVTSAATRDAFRLDRMTPADVARFACTGKRALRPVHGLSIPTFDPRDPDRVLGIVRLNYAQNKHRFITPPAGIAGPVDLVDQPQVVLTTSPLTALRLHQAGVHHVALVEDPAVLVPLRDWLLERSVVLALHQRREADALRVALGPTADRATVAMLSMSPHHLSGAGWAGLGAVVPEPTERPPITPLLLRSLHDAARKHLGSDSASVALGLMEATCPDLVHAYGIGFIPPDMDSGLGRADQRAIAGLHLGRSLIIPAYDDQGLIVDLLVARAHSGHPSFTGCFDHPRGLLAPAISRGTADLIITDTLRWLGRLFTAGYRHVALLRGIEDAEVNAGRLVAAGVRRVDLRVRSHADRFAAILHAAGLAVTITPEAVEPPSRLSVVDAATLVPAVVQSPASVAVEPAPTEEPAVVLPPSTASPSPAPAPAPHASESSVAPPGGPSPAVPAQIPPTLDPRATAAVAVAVATVTTADDDVPTFLEEDRAAAVAIYAVGPVRYAVEVRDDGDTRRRVTVRAHGQSTQDRFDLASTIQRGRFAGNAARRVGLPPVTITRHLTAVLGAMQAREEAQHQAPAVTVSASERSEAATLLDHPDLVGRIAADCTALGWIGEPRAQVLLYLTAVSRLLPEPLWAVFRAQAGATPWQALGCIASLVPPEDRIVLPHITGARLSQCDPRSLRQRLLLIERAEILRPEAALALRVLHERGGLGWATATAGEPASAGSSLAEARGPVAVLAAAAADLDARCRDCFLTIPVDESPEQTAQVLAAQAQRHGGAAPADTAAIQRRHHAAQRLLERLPVVIPYAERIVFPATRVRHREEHACFLGVISTLALLRQRQRARSPAGAILASEADFHDAVRLTDGLLGASRAGISAQAQRLLTALVQRRLTDFTMADLAGIFPDGTRYTFRAALQDLCDFGHLTAGPRSANGRGRLRQYTRVAQAGPRAIGILLRPTDGALIDAADRLPATLAVVGENDVANESPVVAYG